MAYKPIYLMIIRAGIHDSVAILSSLQQNFFTVGKQLWSLATKVNVHGQNSSAEVSFFCDYISVKPV
jgi:hypothetical protein